MTVKKGEAEAIVHALRSGLVPAAGLEHFVTGLEALSEAVAGELDFVAGGRGAAKWLRGEYGAGKTFAARHLCALARRRGFATSEVQISINDTPLHHLEAVYRRLIERLETASDGPNAFQAVVDGWLFQLGEEVTRLKGLSEDDPAFADATEQRLEDRLAELSRKNPAFAQTLRAYHRASQDGDFATAQGLLAWLGGQPTTDRAVLKTAGTRGRVDGQAALTFLAGLLQLLRQSGHAGLVVVLDEVETIQRMPSQSREKALNALRQLMDMLAREELPGLYLVVTGTRDFFEGYKGLKALSPLHQRVHVAFGEDPRWDNLRLPQVRLLPFSEDRLLTVGQRVRDLYPTRAPDRLAMRVDATFLKDLVRHVTDGFGGQVAVAPRLFLRELVDVLDRVDQHPDFDPRAHYRLALDDARLTPEELAVRHGRPLSEAHPGVPPDDGDGDGDAASSAEAGPAPVAPLRSGKGARRLDG